MKRFVGVLTWMVLMLVFIVLILFWSNEVLAGMRTIAWNQNTDGPKGYKAYRSISPDVQQTSENLWLTIWKPGENPELPNLTYTEYVVNGDGDCEISWNILPNGTYFLAWSAFREDGTESGLSNEIFVNIYDKLELGDWEFNWTPIDIPDLVGYRIYIVPHGYPVRVGYGQHYWQDPAPITLPKIIKVPVGHWDSYLTSFDANNKESEPTGICEAIIPDTPPPTPLDYTCQQKI